MPSGSACIPRSTPTTPTSASTWTSGSAGTTSTARLRTRPAARAGTACWRRWPTCAAHLREPARAPSGGSGRAPVDRPSAAGSPAQPRPEERERAARGSQGRAQPALRRRMGNVRARDGLPHRGHRRRAGRGVRQLPRPRHVDRGPAHDRRARLPAGRRGNRLRRNGDLRQFQRRCDASTPMAPRPMPSSRPSGRSSGASPRAPTTASSSPAAC